MTRPPTTPRRRSRSSSRSAGPAPSPPCSHGEPDFKPRPPGVLVAFVTLAVVVIVVLVAVIVVAKLSVLGYRWVVS